MVEMTAFYAIKAEFHHMIHDVKLFFFSVDAFVRQDGRKKCFPHSFPIQSGIPEKIQRKRVRPASNKCSTN